MKKFKYGPLQWYSETETGEYEGNFYTGGTAPVGYDDRGIPVDAEGMQCLSITSPVHPSYEPRDPWYSAVLEDDLPSVKEWRDWFDGEFIEISDERIRREVVRWFFRRSRFLTARHRHLKDSYLTLAELTEAVWQDAPTS